MGNRTSSSRWVAAVSAEAAIFEMLSMLHAEAFLIRQYREIYLEIKRQSLDGKSTSISGG